MDTVHSPNTVPLNAIWGAITSCGMYSEDGLRLPSRSPGCAMQTAEKRAGASRGTCSGQGLMYVTAASLRTYAQDGIERVKTALG